LGLGSTVTWAEFKVTNKKPVLIGWCSQYGIMPLLAFIFAKIFDFPTVTTIGLLLVGIAPGGTSSNLFTYWSHGNLPLSMVLVIFNTICSFFMFPLLVVIYIESSYHSDTIKIDFPNIVYALLVVLVPILIGIAIRHVNTTRKYRDKFIWQWIEVCTSVLGALFVAVPLIVGIIQNTHLFSSSYKLWIASIIYEPLGCWLGYLFSRLAGLSKKDARTIALQTGIQNGTLVIAIISLTFSDLTVQNDCLLFPLFYSFWYIINSVWITTLLRWIATKERDTEASKSGVESSKSGADTSSSPTAFTKLEIQSPSTSAGSPN
jgi:BASS family bile acid:Na+ symporter